MEEEEEEEEAVDGLQVGGPFVVLRPGSRTAYAQRRGGGSVRSVGRRHLRPLAVPMVLVPAFFVAVQCFASNIGTLLRHIVGIPRLREGELLIGKSFRGVFW